MKNKTDVKKPSISQKIKAPKTKKKTTATTSATKSQKAATATHVKMSVDKSSGAKHLSNATDWAKTNMRTPKVIIIAVILVVYFVGSLFFSSHYLPGTKINGTDMSMRSAKTAVQVAQNENSDFSTTVEGDGVNMVIKGSDIDFALDFDAYAASAKSHLPSWTWPVAVFLPRDLQVTDGVSYSQKKLDSLVESAVDKVNEKATHPESATISYDESKKTYVAVAEKEGTAISLQDAIDSVSEGVSTLQTHVELGDDVLEQPEIRADGNDMSNAIEAANKIVNLEIPLTINGKTVETVSSDLIRSWITIDKSYNITSDLDLITVWTRGELSAQVDTVGTARTYTRTNDGKKIEVYGGGTYGWSLDGFKLAELIADQLASGSDKAIEIPMQRKADVYVRGKQDWGPRYLDVDLTEQYVRFFDEDSNVIMESECVSGDTGTDNATVTGVFYIEDKETNKKLIGLDIDEDGEPDYESDVNFWMPFFGGYGLHDALWRDYFGEQVYQVSGSHGCVNLPYYAAELLYSQIKVGDPVIVHY